MGPQHDEPLLSAGMGAILQRIGQRLTPGLRLALKLGIEASRGILQVIDVVAHDFPDVPRNAVLRTSPADGLGYFLV